MAGKDTEITSDIITQRDAITSGATLRDEAYQNAGLTPETIAKTYKAALEAKTPRQQLMPGEVKKSQLRKGWRIVAYSWKTEPVITIDGSPPLVTEYIANTLIECYEPDHATRLKTAQAIVKDLGLAEPDRAEIHDTIIHVHTHIPEPLPVPSRFVLPSGDKLPSEPDTEG